jgi:hypothetical protein
MDLGLGSAQEIFPESAYLYKQMLKNNLGLKQF